MSLIRNSMTNEEVLRWIVEMESPAYQGYNLNKCSEKVVASNRKFYAELLAEREWRIQNDLTYTETEHHADIVEWQEHILANFKPGGPFIPPPRGYWWERKLAEKSPPLTDPN